MTFVTWQDPALAAHAQANASKPHARGQARWVLRDAPNDLNDPFLQRAGFGTVAITSLMRMVDGSTVALAGEPGPPSRLRATITWAPNVTEAQKPALAPELLSLVVEAFPSGEGWPGFSDEHASTSWSLANATVKPLDLQRSPVHAWRGGHNPSPTYGWYVVDEPGLQAKLRVDSWEWVDPAASSWSSMPRVDAVGLATLSMKGAVDAQEARRQAQVLLAGSGATVPSDALVELGAWCT